MASFSTLRKDISQKISDMLAIDIGDRLADNSLPEINPIRHRTKRNHGDPSRFHIRSIATVIGWIRRPWIGRRSILVLGVGLQTIGTGIGIG